MSWQIFKQNILRLANSPESIQDIDTVAKLYAAEYDAAIKRGRDIMHGVSLQKGNVEVMEQLFKIAFIKGQSSTTPYDLVGEMGKGVIAYWQGAQLNTFPIPIIPSPGATINIGVTSNSVTNAGVWAPAIPSPANPYDQLDWSKIPLDKNDPEVQRIIAPDMGEINTIIQTDPYIVSEDTSTYPVGLELDNVKAEIIDNALYEQKILNNEPEGELAKEEQAKLIKSGYKTLDELLKIAGAWAPKLGKNQRVSYANLRSGYIKGVHGLCPQGTQSVVVALTGIAGLGRLSGNADWFSFKTPSTGGGRSSFAVPINGVTYYQDKQKIGTSYTTNPGSWQVGDIVVMGYVDGKPYGHIQVWTGFKWVSDFTQNRIQSNGVDNSTIALWRLNQNGVNAVESTKNKNA
jgi:hypothetical protein